jgi:hypothetical protein
MNKKKFNTEGTEFYGFSQRQYSVKLFFLCALCVETKKSPADFSTGLLEFQNLFPL